MSGYEITDKGKRFLEYFLAKERGEDVYDSEAEELLEKIRCIHERHQQDSSFVGDSIAEIKNRQEG